jgi:hypothetical protein
VGGTHGAVGELKISEAKPTNSKPKNQFLISKPILNSHQRKRPVCQTFETSVKSIIKFKVLFSLKTRQMKPLALLSLLFLFTFSLSAQEYLIDFESSGIATKIDTVVVKNISTGQTVVLAGDQALHLKSALSKNGWEANYPNGALTLFPNPLEDYSTLEFETPESGAVDVDLYNGTGLKLAQVQRTLPAGRHSYQVSGINSGIYLIRINTSGYVFVGKLVSNSTQSDRASLVYLNSVVNENAADMLKSTESLNTLEFKPGDQCFLP